MKTLMLMCYRLFIKTPPLLALLLISGFALAQMPDPHFPQITQGTSVNALAASGDTLFVAGDFARLGTQIRQNIGAIDIQSGAVLPWAPNVNGAVRGLRYQDGLLFLWGAFTQVNGQARNNLAVLDATSGQLHPFNPTIIFPGIPGLQTGTISSLGLVGDTLFLAGYFLSVNGQPRANLAALTLSGNLLPWNPGTDIPIEQILIHDQHVYIGGPFSLPRPGLAAFNRQTGSLLPWNPAPNNPGNFVGPLLPVPGSSDLFVSGRFSHLAGNAHPFLARVDQLSGQPSAFNPGIPYSSPGQVTVNALAQHDEDLFVGGNFNTAFHGAQRAHLAVLNLNTGMPQAWNPSPNSRVNAILHHQGAVFIGGAFTQISGQALRLLAAYNTATMPTANIDKRRMSPVNIFPNPSSDLVWVESDQPLDALAIVDQHGRTISTRYRLSEGTHELSLAGLTPGTYQLVWQSGARSGSTLLQVIR